MIRLICAAAVLLLVSDAAAAPRWWPCPRGKVRNAVGTCIPKNLRGFGPEGHGPHPPPIKPHNKVYD